MLLAHIIIALLTLVSTTATYLKPSATTLKANYFAAALTLTTGVILTIQNPGYLMQACATGLVYFSLVTAFTIAAKKKLAHSTTQ